MDALERAGFVVLVSLAGSRSTRLSWLWAGGVITACAGSVLGLVGGALALAVAVVSAPRRRRSRLAGAVVGGAVGLGAMGLADFDVFGLSLLIGLVAVTPVLVSAVRKLSNRDRRRVRIGVVAVAGLVAVAVLLGGVAAVLARSPLSDGIDESRAGISQARAGKDVAAEASFARAEALFDSAAAHTAAPWALPGRLVPVASQHLGAVHDLASQAADLAAASGAAAGALGGQEVIVDGSIDLDRIRELIPVAADLRVVLDRSIEVVDQTEVGWLAGAVASEIDDLRLELDESAPAVRNAADALEAAPALLGADEPRTYLVLTGNPAEARELGGFAGSYGLLRADAGELSFDAIPFDDIKLARDAGLPTMPPRTPEPYAATQLPVFPQNWTAWPDFPEVSRVTSDLWEQLGLGPVDGTLYTDPATLAALVRFTGPQQIPGTDVKLTPRNTTDLLLREQYERFGDLPNAEVRDLLGDAAEVVFDKLLDGALPAPQVVADTLAPLVAQRRLLFHNLDGAGADLLARTGLDGALITDTPDLLTVTHSNTRVNKVDAYLQKSVDVSVDLDGDTNQVRSTVSVTLTNAAVDGLPGVVTGDESGDGFDELDNRLSLSIYTPWMLGSATVDGADAAISTFAYGALQRHSVTVVVPGGSSVIVVFELVGEIDRLADYRLEILPNATAVPDLVSANVTNPVGTATHEIAEVVGPVELESVSSGDRNTGPAGKVPRSRDADDSSLALARFGAVLVAVGGAALSLSRKRHRRGHEKTNSA